MLEAKADNISYKSLFTDIKPKSSPRQEEEKHQIKPRRQSMVKAIKGEQ